MFSSGAKEREAAAVIVVDNTNLNVIEGASASVSVMRVIEHHCAETTRSRVNLNEIPGCLNPSECRINFLIPAMSETNGYSNWPDVFDGLEDLALPSSIQFYRQLGLPHTFACLDLTQNLA
jgi:hypothetical protein